MGLHLFNVHKFTNWVLRLGSLWFSNSMETVFYHCSNKDRCKILSGETRFNAFAVSIRLKRFPSENLILHTRNSICELWFSMDYFIIPSIKYFNDNRLTSTRCTWLTAMVACLTITQRLFQRCLLVHRWLSWVGCLVNSTKSPLIFVAHAIPMHRMSI